MKNNSVIAIDGPAGSGKSTVAQAVAQALNLLYLDTGAMYRAATLVCINKQVDFSREEDIYEAVKNSTIDVVYNKGRFEVFLEGVNVSNEIRTPIVSKYISRVSEILHVRQILIKRQRELGKSGAVVEGRDIGTVVFPDANYKFFLDADFNVRVERRYREMIARGIAITREEVIKDLKTRDERDMKRQYSPLRRAEDAVYIDTTNLGINEVVEKILSYISNS